MSYQNERDQFIARMSLEGLNLGAIHTLLRCATTINRLAELSCSSEAADRDRIQCPATYGRPCLCDGPSQQVGNVMVSGHERIPRIRLQDWRAEQRAKRAIPAGWTVITEGDPRGYTLRIVPPSYAERNAGRDHFNLDAIGVPSGPSGLRF